MRKFQRAPLATFGISSYYAAGQWSERELLNILTDWINPRNFQEFSVHKNLRR